MQVFFPALLRLFVSRRHYSWLENALLKQHNHLMNHVWQALKPRLALFALLLAGYGMRDGNRVFSPTEAAGLGWSALLLLMIKG